MFKFIKRPGQPASALDVVKSTFKTLGYVLTEPGLAMAQEQLQGGTSPVAIAANFAVITMADELKHAGAATTGILRFRPQATELLEHITEFREQGSLDQDDWQQLYDAIVGISAVSAEQAGWIDRVLQQPVAARLPLARHVEH